MADTMSGIDPNDELNNLNMSEEARPLYEHVKKFIADVVTPMSEEFHELGILGHGRLAERQIAQAHVHEEASSPLDLQQKIPGDPGLALRQVGLAQATDELRHRA